MAKNNSIYELNGRPRIKFSERNYIKRVTKNTDGSLFVEFKDPNKESMTIEKEEELIQAWLVHAFILQSG